MTRILVLAMFLIAAHAHPVRAYAQNVYKCGETYSQQPCAGGKAVAVDDARSELQKSQSGAAARRDAKTADAMEKARVKQESQPAQAYIPPAKAQPQPEQKPERKARKSKKKKPEYFTAVAPRQPGDKAPAKKKRKSKAAAAA